MRILLSVGRGPAGPLGDVVVDCEDEATVADLAEALAAVVPAERAFPPQVRDVGRRLGVVTGGDAPVPAATATRAGPPPDLFHEGRRLDPDEPLASSPVRHGVVLGLGEPVSATLAEPGGIVELRVVSGPGAGTVRRLGLGRHLLGPQAGAVLPPDDAPGDTPVLQLDVAAAGTVLLTPVTGGHGGPAPTRPVPLPGPIVVPRRDGAPGTDRRGSTPPAYVAVDPEADRAPVELDRLAVTGPTPWGPGQSLTVGERVLEISRPTEPDASLSPSPGGATLDFNRPPRLLPAPRVTEFSLPRPPGKPTRQPIPVLMMVAPLVMGGGMYLVTQNLYSLLFVALSPLMMVANWWQGRRHQGRRHADQQREYVERRDRVERAAFEALMAERAARRREAPDPTELLLAATGPRSRLWERRPADPDWMAVRIGTADQPSEVVLSDPERERHQGDLVWTAPDVPVTVDLAEAGVTGVAGRADARRLGAWLVAQVAALHSPADLRLTVLAPGRGAAADWGWTRWLPHLRSDGPGPVVAVGTDDETVGHRVQELVSLLEARREVAQEGVAFQPVLLVLDGARALRLLPGMVALLREGPALGIFALCLDDDVTLLPEECRVVVSPAYGRLRVERTGRPTVDAVRPDLPAEGWTDRLARALAPVHDVSAAGVEATIPTSSRLLTVLRADPPDGPELARGWARGGRTTQAVIGEGAEGVFAVDLVTDGPHGLVAGTTGSGKSELLQTLIASLAVGNRPDEMTFVLIDYKGGAAFKDCVHLPHTVGMVTDLDGHLTTRALESLGAELRRREHQLADAGAKDIEDYLAGRGPDDAPMPRLLIVIDEFAALVAELPDFVTGLVDIARRGRSLGVHLVLATQRPAGVVSAEIKSNTNLRIALRVTDAGDSQDVVESDVAAHISPSTPGRAYARLGHSRLVPFQSSRVGGRPRGEGARASVAAHRADWESLARPLRPASSGPDADDVTTPTDLASLVTAVTEASRITGVPEIPSPWLPPLAEEVLLADLVGDAAPERGVVPPLPLGTADLPARQRQETMTWDLVAGSNLAVAGQSRSGRSSALRLVAAGVARSVDPRDVHVYGIDCGNGALLPLVALPHVGAVVTRDQPDRIRRLLGLLGGEVARRQQLLAASGFADIGEQRAAAEPNDRLPYLLVLLDRWEGFVASFEQADGGDLIERFVALLREGAAVGLRTVVAGDRSTLVGRMGTLLEDRLMLRMPSPDDYSLVGLRPKEVPSRVAPGRAFRSGETPTEVQLALVAADPVGTAQVAELQRLAERAREGAGIVPTALRPRRVDDLPVMISYADAVALREPPTPVTALLVGVGGDTLGVREVDVDRDGPGLLVVGPQRSGRSQALLVTVRDALDRGWTVTVVAPRRSPLRDLGGRPRVRLFTGDEDAAELRGALDTRGPRLLVIDDFEVLGGEHPLAAVAEEYLKGIRDTGDALMVACGVDEVTGMYRGVPAVLRKSRTGLLLAPRSSADGDVFSTRLPRSIGGAVPPGRGILVRAGAWEWLQVPTAPVGD